MEVRPARLADAEAIAAVHVASWQSAYRGMVPQGYLDRLDPAQRRLRWEQILSGSDSSRTETFVALVGARVIGFATLAPTRDTDEDASGVGELRSIYVHPGACGTGSGRELMVASLAALRRSYQQATLWVLEANLRARLFYEAGGWRVDGAVKLDRTRGFALREVRYRISWSGPDSA